MRKLLFILLLSLLVPRAQAAIINAADCTLIGISNAVASAAASGDVILVPAGSAIWTNELVITKSISIIGAGIGQTIISNNFPVNGSNFKLNTPSAATWVRISGFEFRDGGQAADRLAGCINITGPGYYRFDNNYFNHVRNLGIKVTDATHGVLDHNRQIGNNENFVQYWNETIGGNTLGDGAWTNAPTTMGTTNVHCVEDNYLEGDKTVDESNSICDSFGGAFCVYRFNINTNSNGASHGTGDGSGRNRGPVFWEIYNNYFIAANPTTSQNAFHIRGGAGRFFNNVMVGFGKGLTLHDYRYFAMHGKFGKVTGLTAWDRNDTNGGTGGVYWSGTATAGSGNNTLVVAGAGWTVDQWVNHTVYVTNSLACLAGEYTCPPYGASLCEGNSSNWVNQVCPDFASVIIANTADTITVEPGTQSPTVKPFRVGDGFSIRRVLMPFDGIGAGISGLLLDKNEYPVATNLSQGIDGWYSASNLLAGVMHTPTFGPGIYEDPAWRRVFQPTNNFDGSYGVGVGSYAQMQAITATMTNAGFWATNSGTWNLTTATNVQGQLYTWNGAAWVLKWEPLQYPNIYVQQDNVALTPASTNVVVGTSVDFDATGGIGSYVFLFSANNSGGTINSGTGLYTAGTVSQVTDTIISIDPHGNMETASISVESAVNPPSSAIGSNPIVGRRRR